MERIGTPEALELRGKTAVANARVAYGDFLDTFRGDRWTALAAAGARLQRPLWASTSTKNPDYPDTMYVDALVQRDTVDTMPLETIAAVKDHGNPHPRMFGEDDIAEARATLQQPGRGGHRLRRRGSDPGGPGSREVHRLVARAGR